jgi:hypothetical protein
MYSSQKNPSFGAMGHDAMRIVLIALASMFVLSCSVFGIRSEKEPVYKVLHKDGNKEIRQYGAYLVATTWSDGNYEQASKRGFRRLFDYISGNNSDQLSIAMTAPVLQENATNGVTIAMTAPVLQEPDQQGWSMSFVMPATYSMDTLPRPRDDTIVLSEIPATYVAVLRYAGRTHAEKIKRLGQELLAWIETQENYQMTSQPRSARYNPPFTLPFLRRNEIHLDVRKNSE